MNYNFTKDEIIEIFCEVFKDLCIHKNQQNVSCIFHEDRKPSMSVNLDKGVFYCFSCGEKGNIVTLKKYTKGNFNE
ncbi:CHC2 zinc finger domain-containing protein [Bacteriovoracaceae bacterium]|nr:CHC2 zinc finger domain-containing protein [Bacteriovoracaceae bacterium]